MFSLCRHSICGSTGCTTRKKVVWQGSPDSFSYQNIYEHVSKFATYNFVFNRICSLFAGTRFVALRAAPHGKKLFDKDSFSLFASTSTIKLETTLEIPLPFLNDTTGMLNNDSGFQYGITMKSHGRRGALDHREITVSGIIQKTSKLGRWNPLTKK